MLIFNRNDFVTQCFCPVKTRTPSILLALKQSAMTQENSKGKKILHVQVEIAVAQRNWLLYNEKQSTEHFPQIQGD